ncbi:hypothetical protein FXV83_10745 [Bradyrhizobium hipponense]|uniref:Uncharacterized protein n=1 Tax=Bradyrhizobium hipponense TaxID=2605638 RepID=A0A5S4YSZ9_9BRAD|nr:hypothetical protein [Bradyrhizobium hipponense]TYO66597.1 hypothetical protein FXV83_10745 [Bradyrhizobium hipponense]
MSDDDTGPPRTFKGLLRWATTPPQAWGVYLLAIILVWLLSFYAGTLKPKKTPQGEPPPITAPKG